MQLYVASRPMFMDVEVMNKDAYILQGSGSRRVPDMITGLCLLYTDITGMCSNLMNVSFYLSRYESLVKSWYQYYL